MKIISSSGTASPVFKALKQIWIPFVFCLMTVALSRNVIWFFELSKNSSCRCFHVSGTSIPGELAKTFSGLWGYWKLLSKGFERHSCFYHMHVKIKITYHPDLKKNSYKYGKSSFRSKIVHEWVKRFESDRRLFVDGMIS